PRDIYWRKSTQPNQRVLRERGRETRREVGFVLDSPFPGTAPTGEWSSRFERRIREIASRAVAHLKRADAVPTTPTAGERARSTAALGADPLLRFLARLEARQAPPSAPERLPRAS